MRSYISDKTIYYLIQFTVFIFCFTLSLPGLEIEDEVLPVAICRDEFFSYRYGYRMFVYEDKVWVYNGLINPRKSYSEGKKYVSEIWCSEDGIHFMKVVEDSIIDDDTGYAIATFNSSLIAIGRRDSENDVLISKDGYEWRTPNREFPFQPRNRAQLLVFQNKLWLIGGTGQKDLWVTDDGIKWLPALSPIKDAYSDIKAVAFEDKLILLSSEEGILITSDGVEWEKVEVNPELYALIGSYPDSYRKGFDLVEYKESLYLLGGGGWNSPGHNAYFDPIEELAGSYNDVWRSSNGRDWEQIARVRDDLPQEKETAIRYSVEHDPNPDNLEYWELIDKYSHYSFSQEEILTAYQAQYRSIYETYSPALEFHAVVFNDKIYLYNYYEIWTTEDGIDWTLLAFLENQ